MKTDFKEGEQERPSHLSRCNDCACRRGTLPPELGSIHVGRRMCWDAGQIYFWAVRAERTYNGVTP
jgi:hypothetical protein